ncbi:hypothetical protein ABIA65_002453 [Mycolicibacterium sp. 624]
MPELVHAPLDQRVGNHWIRGGARVTHGATSDAAHGAGDGIGVTSIDDDAEPLAGQEFGDGEPDAPGAADDDGTPSAQLASSWPNFIASMFQ